LVRTGESLKSTEAMPPRLSCGALVQELKLVGSRLHFRRLSGHGPEMGWVSLKLKDKDLLVRRPVSAQARHLTPVKTEATPTQAPCWNIFPISIDDDDGDVSTAVGTNREESSSLLSTFSAAPSEPVEHELRSTLWDALSSEVASASPVVPDVWTQKEKNDTSATSPPRTSVFREGLRRALRGTGDTKEKKVYKGLAPFRDRLAEAITDAVAMGTGGKAVETQSAASDSPEKDLVSGSVESEGFASWTFDALLEASDGLPARRSQPSSPTRARATQQPRQVREDGSPSHIQGIEVQEV